MRNEQYAVLTDELRNDPLGIGYANMTDDEAAVSLNEQPVNDSIGVHANNSSGMK